MEYNVKEATEYLATGGLGEVIGLTDLARKMEQPKVQLDTDMAMSLCLLAGEALKARASNAGDMMSAGLVSSRFSAGD